MKWRKKQGIGDWVGEREKLAEKTRGEWAGWPNRPRPDLSEKEKGSEALGEYESLSDGPDEKLVESEKENSEGEAMPVVAVTAEVKGLLNIAMGTLAVMI